MPFCETAPLLLSVTWQQNRMENWWEGSASSAIPPTCTSDVADQCNKMEALLLEHRLCMKQATAFHFGGPLFPLEIHHTNFPCALSKENSLQWDKN